MGLFGSMAEELARTAGRADKKKKSQEAHERWKAAHIQEERDIEEIYQKFVERCRKEFSEIEEGETIRQLLVEIVKEDPIFRDYSLIDKLPESYRHSQVFKEEMEQIKEITYMQCVDAYLNYNKSVQYCMLMLKPLEYVEEIKEEIEYSLTHYEYLAKPGQDIRSVLTGFEDFVDGLEYADENSEFDRTLMSSLYDSLNSIENLYQEKKYQEAFNCITCAEFDESIYDYLKCWLITTGTRKSNKESVSKVYEMVRKMVDDMIRAMRLVRDKEDEHRSKFVRIPVVDMIVADALFYDQTGMVANVDEELDLFLNNFIINKDEDDASQFEVLRQAFAFIKAYEQEKKVLEFMVFHNITRTDAQDKRLVYLKSERNGESISSNSVPTEICVENSEDKVTYDYRCLSWNETQIRKYVNSFSDENRVMDTLAVIDEWNNNLDANNVVWDIDAFRNFLNAAFINNFGEKYNLNIVEAGALQEGWIEYEETVYIEEQYGGKYPWIKFIISAEQLTISQISFSIYTLYVPNEDFENESECFQRNSLLGNRLVSLKLKQNPKVNNYISIMKDIMISELEKYLNCNTQTDSLY